MIGFIDWIQQPDYGVVDMALLFVARARHRRGGRARGRLARGPGAARTRLASPGLYPVASLATAGARVRRRRTLHGSGFLAVYLAGLVLGSARIPAKQTVTAFHEGLAWVAQIAMFLALGLLVFPSQLGDVWLEGTVLALVLVFVARPLPAASRPRSSRFTAGERIVLGWAGLRGAVPVVLATFPVIEGIDARPRVLQHRLLRGGGLDAAAGHDVRAAGGRLGVTTGEPALPRPLVETGTIRRLGAEVVEYPVGADDAIVGLRVRELGLPRDALVNVIVRGEEAMLPRGSTRIEAGDRLHVLVRQEVASDMEELLERWRSGRSGPAARPRPCAPGAAVFTTRPWAEADGDPGPEGGASAWRSSSGSARAATCPARSSCSPTGATP